MSKLKLVVDHEPVLYRTVKPRVNFSRGGVLFVIPVDTDAAAQRLVDRLKLKHGIDATIS